MSVMYKGIEFSCWIVETKDSDKTVAFKIQGMDDRYLYRIKDGYSKAVHCKSKHDPCNPIPLNVVDMALRELELLNQYGMFSYTEYINKPIVASQPQPQMNIARVQSQPRQQVQTVNVGNINMVSVINNATGDIAMFTSNDDVVAYSLGKTITMDEVIVPMPNRNQQPQQVYTPTVRETIVEKPTIDEVPLIDDSASLIEGISFNFDKSYEQLIEEGIVPEIDEPINKPKEETKEKPKRKKMPTRR